MVIVKLNSEINKILRPMDVVTIDYVNGVFLGENKYKFFTNTLPEKGMVCYKPINKEFQKFHLEKHIDNVGEMFDVVVNNLSFYYTLEY